MLELKAKNYVFILFNETYSIDVSIMGISNMPMDALIEELDNPDALPSPHSPFATIQTERSKELLEAFDRHLRKAHSEMCDDEQPELYWLHRAMAFGILFDVATELGLDDIVATVYDDGKPRQAYPHIGNWFSKDKD